MYDKQLLFHDAAIGTTAATTYSTVVPIGQQAFPEDGMRFYAQITTTATSGGSATLQLILQKDTTAAFPSATAVLTSSAVAVASLVAGYTYWDIDMSSIDYAEAAGADTYLRVAIIIGTADLTAGDIKMWIGSAGAPVKNKS